MVNPEWNIMRNREIQYELLQPWSTFVMVTKLPPLILEKMIRITDEIVENGKTISAEESGSGQLKNEFSVEHETLERGSVMEYFLDVTRHFVIQQKLQQRPFIREEILNDEWYTKMTTMWIVSQKDNEYQPAHGHSNCNISSVMYLKIPEYLPNKNPTLNDDGAITFVAPTCKLPDWGSSTMALQPKVGDFYIFAPTMNHFVYPFRTADGKGERRSVAFNAVFTSKSEQDIFKKQQQENN
jgi:hypothetical protein